MSSIVGRLGVLLFSLPFSGAQMLSQCPLRSFFSRLFLLLYVPLFRQQLPFAGTKCEM